MSKLLVSIKEIKNCDSLNIVVFDFFGTELKMMSLELPQDIKVGTKVIISAKPTAVTLAKNFSGDISFSNELKGEIVQIDEGELLCNVKLNIANSTFESIITKDSSRRLDLKVGERITAFIKASDISISEVVYD